MPGGLDLKPDAGISPAIRRAGIGDVEQIVSLCRQLGYPASPQQVQRRLDEILDHPNHAVYVAERPGGGVIGWVHVLIRRLLVVDRQAEIGGLVVDDTRRRRGVGRLLMDRAGAWARARGCEAVMLRSNAVRAEAHLFYERIGYEQVKTSHVFRKAL